MINRISMIGGDLRIIKLAEMLLEEGAQIFSYGLEKADVKDLNKGEDLQTVINQSNIILAMVRQSILLLVMKKYWYQTCWII